MRYIVFEECAVDELVSNRFFQTIEFDLGRALFELVAGHIPTANLPPEISLVKLDEGIAFTSKKASKNSHFLVLDLEQSDFIKEISENETIFVLQKTLRFAKKLWQNLSLNFSERVIPSSSKAILFPFPYKPTPYRVVIEQAPWSERLKKRNFAGKFLLVYKTGYGKGDANTEQAGLTNFKKAFEQIDKILSEARALNSDQTSNAPGVVQVSALDAVPSTNETSIFQSFDDWMKLLTNKQIEFINAEVTGAHRIEGAAGTGKTLCLMLKAISLLRKSEVNGSSKHIVFVTHSEATKRSIKEFLVVIDQDNFASRDRLLEKNTLKVCTLSELCAEQLAHRISDSEFIDRDALESKETQLLYVSEAYNSAMNADYPSHERFLSAELKDFLKKTESWNVTQMLQHEISVVIKGRASEDIDAYKKAPPLKYGIPINSDADKGFIFSIFRKYQEQLGAVSQFDTDDVVLTAIGQLDTPVWRRRRTRDGYDVIFIDETHLFNINELHIFHYFTKSDAHFPIIYSVDRTQAVGDHGWTNQDIAETLSGGAEPEDRSKLQTVFRSSPQIVELAFSIVSSGATLFTNFDNPLEATASSFTDKEERMAAQSVFRSYPNDQAMIEAAFERAEVMQREMTCKKGKVLIVGFDKEVVDCLHEYASSRNKPHLLLKKRGDVEAVGKAEASGKFVLAHADFVGGLEFFGVVAVGVDKGRLPPNKDQSSDNSKHFLSYASHNRLYVAVSRAKYRVELLGDQSRGPSILLEPAVQSRILTIAE
ncbi:UvrD-helicase domain-containing protein [Roseibium litorale]|uniref:DNA 3'-5' helicase II n=1 Tax=Roseibium litorale TaxID=2803841 RepID=A0ABR9CSY9_9HYPH|nr:UvrD-helicase domain-containing protein [Roseibium litorale]MBD8893515.1 UvrD-helicase domain-containing protein [Roseibium litorale]